MVTKRYSRLVMMLFVGLLFGANVSLRADDKDGKLSESEMNALMRYQVLAQELENIQAMRSKANSMHTKAFINGAFMSFVSALCVDGELFSPKDFAKKIQRLVKRGKYAEAAVPAVAAGFFAYGIVSALGDLVSLFQVNRAVSAYHKQLEDEMAAIETDLIHLSEGEQQDELPADEDEDSQL